MFQLKDSPGDLRWWWHSHVDMDVFWSGTDMGTLKQLGMGGWFAATVFNQKNEMRSAFVQSAPVRLIADQISTKVTNQFDPWAKHREQWDEDYDENVEIKTFASSFTSNYSSKDKSILDYARDFTSKFHNSHGSVEEVGDDEEETEELGLDEIFEQHAQGQISDEELYDLMRDMDDPEEAEAYAADDDDCGILTDEEAQAMDMANGVWDDDSDDDQGTVPLI
jgi:hypothetical protein